MLEMLLIIYAECEQDPSTAIVRMAGSSLANPFAVVAASVASLRGTLHGGSIEQCILMFKRIGSTDKVGEFIKKCKTKEEKLFGFGNKVFEAYDPRAKLVKSLLLEFNEQIGI